MSTSVVPTTIELCLTNSQVHKILRDDITNEPIESSVSRVDLPFSKTVNLSTLIKHYHYTGRMEDPFTRAHLSVDIATRINASVVTFKLINTVHKISTATEIGKVIMYLFKHSSIQSISHRESVLSYDVIIIVPGMKPISIYELIIQHPLSTGIPLSTEIGKWFSYKNCPITVVFTRPLISVHRDTISLYMTREEDNSN